MSEIEICCPQPDGPSYSGDCESLKSYCWSSDTTDEILYYLPTENRFLTSFSFSGLSNNGSSITAQVVYYNSGNLQYGPLWDLGELNGTLKQYFFFNFGDSLYNNTFQLKITTFGGTSGCLQVYFDCSIPVLTYPFCNCTELISVPATPPTETLSLYPERNPVYSMYGTQFMRPGYALNGLGNTQVEIRTASAGGSYTGTLWGNPFQNFEDGPLNRTGLYSSPSTTDLWVGFSACLTGITTEKTYYVGVAADNEFRLVLDGNELLNTYGNVWTEEQFKWWHVYPVTITTGNHVLELYGLNLETFFAFGCEIYDNTLEELTGFTSYNQLNVIFTSNGIGEATLVQNIDEQYTSSGFTCPSGYVYSTCSGTCVNYGTCIEECRCNGDTVFLYSEIVPGFDFPFEMSGKTWYLDPELQIPAPCGLYLTNTNGKKLKYQYYCTTSSSELLEICGDECPTVKCSSGGTGNNTFTHTEFTLSNPYISGTTEISDNGVFFYSEHCLNIIYDRKYCEDGYYPITVSFIGNPDNVVVTLSDIVSVAGVNSDISYSLIDPTQAAGFFPALSQTLLKVPTPENFLTFYVIPPSSAGVKVRVMVGYKTGNQSRESVVSRIDYTCSGTCYYKYTVGLHAYSAYDSIVNPRLTTTLYSLKPYTEWTVNNTFVFAERLLTQPAFPYYYGLSANDTVYKVGDPFYREWGTKKLIRSGQKKFKYKFTEVILPAQFWVKEYSDNDKRAEMCIDPFMDMGIIKTITPLLEVKIPTSYSYLLGYTPDVNNPAHANDFYFTYLQYDNRKSLTPTHVPLTGYEHAVWKLSDALRQGFQKYMKSFNSDVNEAFIRTRGKNLSRAITYGSIAISVALTVITVLTGGGAGLLVGLAKSLLSAGIGKIFSKVFSKVTNTIGKGIARLLYGKKVFDPTFWANKGGKLKQLLCPPEVSTQPKPKINIKWGDAAAVSILATLYLYKQGYSKTYYPDCREIHFEYTNTPYIFEQDEIYDNVNLSAQTAGVYCDGSYFYNHNGSGATIYVTQKYLSYKTLKGVRYLSMNPDSPLYVTDIPSLLFLSYISGRPEKFGAQYTYSNTKKSFIILPNNSIVGDLNNPLPMTFEAPAGMFLSDVSQEDADTQAELFLSGYTAATITTDYSYEDKPGTTDEQYCFTHTISIEDNPNTVVVNYQDESNIGPVSGTTKFYYDEDGHLNCLTGYYATLQPTEEYFKKFYQVDSGGTVVDIWVMTAETDNFVTSQYTEIIAPLTNNFPDYVSGWFFKSDEIPKLFFNIEYNVNGFFETWGTEEFYDNPIIRRGFIKDEGGQNFFLYNSNYSLESGYTYAEESFYKEITSDLVFPFAYDLNIYIETEEICSLTGSTGLTFRLKDVSGNTISSVYGTTFDAEIYVSYSYSFTEQITFNINETEVFVPLDPIYQGTITNVNLTNFISGSTYGNVTFIQGGFTGCSGCFFDATVEYIPSILQDVYIDVCTNANADSNGQLEVFAFADTISGSGGTSLVNVSDNVTTYVSVFGSTSGEVSGFVTIPVGQQYGVQIYNLNLNESINSITITSVTPENSYSQLFLTGATSYDGSCSLSSGTFTIDILYGLQVDTINVSTGSLPSFVYPLSSASETMVSNYMANTQFEITLTGTRTQPVNMSLKLLINGVVESCTTISSDPSYTQYYLTTLRDIFITDDISINIYIEDLC